MPSQAEFDALFGGSLVATAEPSPVASVGSVPTLNFHTPLPWEMEDDEEKKRQKRRDEFEKLMGSAVERGADNQLVAKPGDPKLSLMEKAAPWVLPWVRNAPGAVAGTAAGVAAGAASANPVLGLGAGFAGAAAVGKLMDPISQLSAKLQGYDMDVSSELAEAAGDARQQHPVASRVNEFATQAVAGSPSAKLNLAGRAVGAGVGAGMATSSALMEGRLPSAEDLLLGLAGGAVFDKSWLAPGAKPQPATKPAGQQAKPRAPQPPFDPFATAAEQTVVNGRPVPPAGSAPAQRQRPPAPIPPSTESIRPLDAPPRPGDLVNGRPWHPEAAAQEPGSPIPPPPRPEQAKAIAETQAQMDALRSQMAGVKMTPKQRNDMNGYLEGLRLRLEKEMAPDWKSPAEKRAARMAEMAATPRQDAPVGARSPLATQEMPAMEAEPAQAPETITQEIPAPPPPGPDRTVWLDRGKQDAVPAVFPDKAHADLFRWAATMKRAVQGRDTLPPQETLKALSEAFGADEQTTQALAMDYHDHVRTQGLALPANFDEAGTIVEAPSLLAKRPAVAELPLMPRAAAEEAGMGALHEVAVHEAFANGQEIAPENIAAYPDLQQALEAMGQPLPDAAPFFPMDGAGQGADPDASLRTNPNLMTNPNLATNPNLTTHPNLQTNPNMATNPDIFRTQPAPRRPNLGAIHSVHDAMASVRETAALYGEKTAKVKRAVTLQEAAPLIQQLTGLTADQLNAKRPAGGMTRHELAAWASHLQEANIELMRAAKAVEMEPTAENLARYGEIEARHAVLQSVVEPGATEVGRALNMLQDISLGRSRAQRIAAILKANGCD